uniref:Uncharacterized protein n=1 Tax=Ixodes ricinus TaxID=34613 RepID=A0A6B0VAV0_IXORI
MPLCPLHRGSLAVCAVPSAQHPLAAGDPLGVRPRWALVEQSGRRGWAGRNVEVLDLQLGRLVFDALVVHHQVVSDGQLVVGVAAQQGAVQLLLLHPKLLADDFHSVHVDDRRIVVVRQREEVGWEVLLKPVMVFDVLHGCPFHWIHLEGVDQQAHHRFVQVVRNGEDARLDLSEQGWDVFVVEWKGSAEQRIEYYTAAPNVYFRTGVEFARDDLWGCVIWGPTARPQEFAVHHHVREPKVGDLDVEVLVQEQVFGFQVPVDHHVPVTVRHSGDYLLEEPPGIRLLQLPMLDDVIKEFTTAHILHDHENVGGCADDLVQFDDMRVPEELEVLYFTADLAHDIEILYLLPVQYLHCNLVARQLMAGGLHFSKRADAEGFS